MSRQFVVAVDFDGTCVEHDFPRVGRDIPNAVKVLKLMQEENWKIILWTMRSGETLEDARRWFEDRGIELWGVNENPTQANWTQSPKAYANFYIDDAAVGCPLLPSVNGQIRERVDWEGVRRILGLVDIDEDLGDIELGEGSCEIGEACEACQ